MSSEWYVLLLQWENVMSKVEDKYSSSGSAWDYVFAKAASESAAVSAAIEGPCTVKGFKRGPKTTVMVHRIMLLDDAMEEKDVTIQPRRRRIKRAKI